MADVFISYSKEDRSIAETLASDLKSAGISVWWDFELYTGEDFHDTILAALDAAKVVVVIWSDAAVISRWVRGEADHAANANKLVPLSVPGFDVHRLPLNFRVLHTDVVTERSRLLRALERFNVVPSQRIELGEGEKLLASAAEHHEVGDLRLAIADYHRAVELCPRCAPAYRGLASVLTEKGEDHDAIDWFTKAIEIDGTNADDYFRRGLAYTEIGSHGHAIADFTKAVELEPSHMGARDALKRQSKDRAR